MSSQKSRPATRKLPHIKAVPPYCLQLPLGNRATKNSIHDAPKLLMFGIFSLGFLDFLKYSLFSIYLSIGNLSFYRRYPSLCSPRSGPPLRRLRARRRRRLRRGGRRRGARRHHGVTVAAGICGAHHAPERVVTDAAAHARPPRTSTLARSARRAQADLAIVIETHARAGAASPSTVPVRHPSGSAAGTSCRWATLHRS